MNKDKVSQYANEIPEEIKLTVKALGDDIRLAILVALMKKGKMTYTDLKNTFELNGSSLSYALAALQDGGLIMNFLMTGKGHYSYYDVTEFAKSVLKSLFDTIVSVRGKYESPLDIGGKTDNNQIIEAAHTSYASIQEGRYLLSLAM